MTQTAHDEPRTAAAVRRGWHIKRIDGTWGLVARVTRTGDLVMLAFEDRDSDDIEAYPANQLYLTRTPAQQMHAAAADIDARATMIKALYRQRRALRAHAAQHATG